MPLKLQEQIQIWIIQRPSAGLKLHSLVKISLRAGTRARRRSPRPTATPACQHYNFSHLLKLNSLPIADWICHFQEYYTSFRLDNKTLLHLQSAFQGAKQRRSRGQEKSSSFARVFPNLNLIFISAPSDIHICTVCIFISYDDNFIWAQRGKIFAG